ENEQTASKSNDICATVTALVTFLCIIGPSRSYSGTQHSFSYPEMPDNSQKPLRSPYRPISSHPYSSAQRPKTAPQRPREPVYGSFFRYASGGCPIGPQVL